MARDRQRAKQRQAERRAKRLEQEGRPPETDAPRRREEPPVIDDPTTVEPSPAVSPELAVGAPPTDEGRSDQVLRDEQRFDEAAAREDDPPPADLEDAWQEIEDWEIGKDGEKDADGSFAPRGRRGEDKEADRKRPRVIQFLIACWAELQRVQWPDRQALTTLTGVVLGFVLIAGGYLGLLDAIFSRLVNALL